MNLHEIGPKVVAAVKNAATFIAHERLNFKLSHIESKGLHDFVSYVDKGSEKILIEALSEILPDATFIAEEGTVEREESSLMWIIDPLDGTTNFIHDLNPYAISVALMYNHEIVLGVIHEVSANECFYSWKDCPVYLNGKEISCSEVKRVEDSLIATGFPYYDYNRMQEFLVSLEYFMRHSHGVRRLGSAATDLAYVACGRFEGFYEYGLSPWDVAAGVFLVRQAGGKVCDYRLGNDYIFGKEVVAANSHVFNEFSSAINKIYIEKISLNKTESF